MDDDKQRELTKEVSNAIWNAISKYAEPGATFSWDLEFTEEGTEETIDIGQ